MPELKSDNEVLRAKPPKRISITPEEHIKA
jgi:hypothetical protein